MLRESLLSLLVLASVPALALPETTNIKLKSHNISDTIRIVGGEEVKPHSRPYQASIQSLDGSHFCGGSIVGRNLVLTAAHCMEGVNGESPQMQVRVGAHSLVDGSGQTIKVATAYTNQEYPNLSKDVAVLKLVEDITDVNAKAISLVDKTFFNNHIKTGTTLTVSGWGTLSSGGSMPEKLMAVDVPYVTNEVCNSAEAYSGQIQDTEMCAGFQKGGKDSCQGDSGGPLVYTKNNQFYQVGVVSWGDGCALENKYGVYADVAALKTWIDSAISGNETPSGMVGGSEGGDESEYGAETFMAFQETLNYTLDEEALAFVLEVPEGLNVIYIATRGGEGDVDITAELLTSEEIGTGHQSDDYLDFELNETFLSSENIGNEEMIVIEFPQSGEWVISFSDFTEYKDVELTVFAH